MQQRLDSIENEFDVVKELLMSAARYAESANQRIDRVGEKLERLGDRVDQLSAAQDRTQGQLDQLGIKVDSIATAQHQTQQQLDQVVAIQQQIQRVLMQTAERQSRNDAAIESLAASVGRLTQVADRTLGSIAEMQSEVRGLQTENRRIWEILQERNGGSEG
jgi:chromosome segregation ATPase